MVDVEVLELDGLALVDRYLLPSIEGGHHLDGRPPSCPLAPWALATTGGGPT